MCKEIVFHIISNFLIIYVILLAIIATMKLINTCDGEGYKDALIIWSTSFFGKIRLSVFMLIELLTGGIRRPSSMSSRITNKMLLSIFC